MALANIAVLLARRGMRVLAVDWDLEAPGLDRYFRSYTGGVDDAQIGLLDLLFDSSTQKQKPDWRRYTTEILFNNQFSLTLLTSGRQDKSYASRVLRFDWNEFFTNCDGGNVIEALRDDWKKEFDVTLVDSRTGITDAGGICTIQLPDILVPVFTTNEQSLQGSKDVVLRAQLARQKLAFDRMPLLVFPLPSRFEGLAEYEEAKNWLNIFSTELAQFYEDWLPKQFSPLQILERTKLPYVAYFSFGEKLPVITEGTSDPQSLGYAYLAAATLIENDFKDAAGLISGGALLSDVLTSEAGWQEKDKSHQHKALSTIWSIQEFFDNSIAPAIKSGDLSAPPINSRIRILFTGVSPMESLKIPSNSKMRDSFATLQKGDYQGSYEFISKTALTAVELQEELLKYLPHVVHFFGHGNQSEAMRLEDSSSEDTFINEEALNQLFRILRDNVQIVVFDACYSRAHAEKLTETIDYVVYISESISDKPSKTFFESFYKAIAFGRSVEDAFSLAQNALDLSFINLSTVPVLFVRNGASAAVPLLLQVNGRYQQFVDQLKLILGRIADGTSAKEEREVMRQTLLSGKINFSRKNISSAEAFPQGFNIIPHDHLLEIELSNALYSRLQEQLYPPTLGLGPAPPGLILVGRENSLNNLKELLGSGMSSPNASRVIVVRGWPGVGKTTLVSVLSRDPEVLQVFPDGVLWSSLDQNPELMSKLAAWGRALGTDNLGSLPTLDEATAELTIRLRNKRMLLVLDDVWDGTCAFPFLKARADTKSSLLITTRLTSVAEELVPDPAAVYVLPPLSEDAALTLLRLIVPMQVEQYPDECREIVRELGCIPLALHVAGRLIKAESRMGLDVTDVLQEIKEGRKLAPEPAPIDMSISSTTPTVYALLERSVNGLDEYTRECFALLGAFAPEPATFDLASMATVWQVQNPKPIVRKLIGRGLLEPIGAGRFHMNILMVKYARSLLA